MAKVGEKYKCFNCGHEVVVTHSGVGTLVCCGKPMKQIAESCECPT